VYLSEIFANLTARKNFQISPELIKDLFREHLIARTHLQNLPKISEHFNFAKLRQKCVWYFNFPVGFEIYLSWHFNVAVFKTRPRNREN